MNDRARNSKRPYLIRAMPGWMMDNGETPHVIVDAEKPGVEVPRAYVKDGKVVLNLSSTATQRLVMGNDWIEFEARFAGVVHHVRIPVSTVRLRFRLEAKPLKITLHPYLLLGCFVAGES